MLVVREACATQSRWSRCYDDRNVRAYARETWPTNPRVADTIHTVLYSVVHISFSVPTSTVQRHLSTCVVYWTACTVQEHDCYSRKTGTMYRPPVLQLLRPFLLRKRGEKREKRQPVFLILKPRDRRRTFLERSRVVILPGLDAVGKSFWRSEGARLKPVTPLRTSPRKQSRTRAYTSAARLANLLLISTQYKIDVCFFTAIGS